MPTEVKNKVCLIVHDGWGIAPEKNMKGDAIAAGDTTDMDAIAKSHSYTTLAAHGSAVGLSDGLMGNSEVGHLNIGAGRVVWQDILRIGKAVDNGEFQKMPNIAKCCKHAKEGTGRLHLLGLVSDGGVHSHITQLFAMLETAKAHGIPHTYVHFFGDGRDTAPNSSAMYCEQLLDFMKKVEYGELATVVGRYYAMDRDKRWERIKIAVDALVKGDGEEGKDAVAAIKAKYEKKETDEFLKPIIVNGDEGRIKDGDTLFFFNYRSDRMRELVSVFGIDEKPMEVDVPKNLNITTMSTYKSDFTFNVAFPPHVVPNSLAEWLSGKGIKQAHVAESEKYAHVTFFFNGGIEKQYEKEERFLIPSPKVPVYSDKPEMSVQAVADKVAELVKAGEHEFIMCNFAPPDMVGHTGVFDAAVKAIGATDKAVGTVYKACEEAGYVLLVTADHGNAEQMLNAKTGEPHTAHTTNRVPFIMTGDAKTMAFVESEDAKKPEGALCDVAPTVLEIMGLPIPKDMTGRSLLKK